MHNYGFEVESIRCPRRPPNITVRFIKRTKHYIKGAAKLLLAIAGVKKYRDKLISKIKCSREKQDQDTNNARYERIKILISFYDKYITGIYDSTYHEALTSNKSRWRKYDYAVAGSDQIWNAPHVQASEALKFYYLYFIERNKRVCYAPSFGIPELQKRYSIHKKGLKGFNKLSCREKSGCDLIKKLIGQDAQLVLDPTLLFNADWWRKISRKPDYKLPKRYALAYFFGIPKEYKSVINQIIKTENLELIDIFDPEDKLHFLTGPQEFLYLVDHAEIIFTGSFHGTAFSINFEKKFISFGESNSRIESILSQLNLMNRLYKNGHEIPSGEINYNEVNEKLNILRESSLKYLRDCLHV